MFSQLARQSVQVLFMVFNGAATAIFFHEMEARATMHGCDSVDSVFVKGSELSLLKA
jgi:hypothetical protein